MPIYLLDDTISLNIYYDQTDCQYEDNVCLSFYEDCPQEEKIFRAGQTNIYLTREQARRIAEALLKAASESCLEGESGTDASRAVE
jgi:hypothetical protein